MLAVQCLFLFTTIIPNSHHGNSDYDTGMCIKPSTNIKSVKIVLVCQASQSSGLPNVCSLQMGGSLLRTEFSNAAGSSMQVDRGSSSWMPPRHENTMGTQLPGPPPLVPGQMGSTNPSPRPQLVGYLPIFCFVVDSRCSYQ